MEQWGAWGARRGTRFKLQTTITRPLMSASGTLPIRPEQTVRFCKQGTAGKRGEHGRGIVYG